MLRHEQKVKRLLKTMDTLSAKEDILFNWWLKDVVRLDFKTRKQCRKPTKSELDKFNKLHIPIRAKSLLALADIADLPIGVFYVLRHDLQAKIIKILGHHDFKKLIKGV